MTVETFGLRAPQEGKSQQQTPQAVRAEEQRADQTPNPKTPETEKVEGKTEHQEGKESLEARYNRLAIEAGDIKRNREITFQFSSLQSEGLQTLIAEYGADSVFDAIKKQFQSKGQGTFSTFEVVRALEPDKTKRSALYEKMLADAKQEAERFDQRQKNEDAESYDYFRRRHGIGENFARGAQFRIQAMKSLDSVFGKVLPQRQYKILRSSANEFATYVSQFEDEETKLKEELKQAGDDIFRLVEERSKITDGRTEQLRSQANELREELSAEIQRITDELNTKLEEYRARVVNDLSKVGSLEMESEEVRAALQGVLEKIEDEIKTREEATQKEIADSTAPLGKMMDGVASLDRI